MEEREEEVSASGSLDAILNGTFKYDNSTEEESEEFQQGCHGDDLKYRVFLFSFRMLPQTPGRRNRFVKTGASGRL